MKKIYSLLLLIIFTSCSVSPNSTPNSRKGDIVQDADITMIDSSFNIKYYPLAELKCSYNDIQKVAHVVDFQ